VYIIQLLQHYGSSDDQEYRYGKLKNDQRFPDSASTCSEAEARFQDIDKPEIGKDHRRIKPCSKAYDNTSDEQYDQRRRTEENRRFKFLAGKVIKERQRYICKEERQYHRNKRDQQRFSQELPEYLESCSAHDLAYAYLRGPGGRLRGSEVGIVYRCNAKDQEGNYSKEM
jgi:serine phosphatase RsbU (regulator of sigma subunit)